MSDISEICNDELVHDIEIEKPIKSLQPKQIKCIIYKKTIPWYYTFNTKSTKYFKLDRDFKDANLEGTPFYYDYRIKKN